MVLASKPPTTLTPPPFCPSPEGRQSPPPPRGLATSVMVHLTLFLHFAWMTLVWSSG